MAQVELHCAVAGEDEMRVRVVTADALEAFGDPDRLLANVNTSIEYRAIEANGMQS